MFSRTKPAFYIFIAEANKEIIIIMIIIEMFMQVKTFFSAKKALLSTRVLLRTKLFTIS